MSLTFRLPHITTSLYPADVMLIIVAASLPWSTSIPAIFVGFWLLGLVPAIDFEEFKELVKRPGCWLPVAFFLLGAAGLFWSDAPWSERLYALGPLTKLLAIPLLIYHLQRSTRGMLVFVAFLVSCIAVMALSWIVTIEPALALKPDAYYGVPIKNYIDQSQEFALCAVGLLYAVSIRLKQKRYLEAFVFLALSTAFFTNMAFVVVSRTALVTIPIMLCVYILLCMNYRSAGITVGLAVAFSLAVWFTAPNLQERVATFFSQYEAYHTSNASTSIGMRLEFWRKSFEFFHGAPILGNGTGSVKMLFTEAVEGQTGASAEIVANPHNQTLYNGIQWGIVGVIVLYAMWLAHLLLFRGNTLAHWIGLLVVIQNIASSLFNSHIADFHEGWMYVLGVGVAGGMVLQNDRRPASEPASPERSFP